MVKKKQNPYHINYKEGIVENCLLQIRNTGCCDDPRVKNVWTVDIRARDSQQFIEFIRLNIQSNDPVSFQHIKRIKKGEESGVLTVIVCSKLLIEEQDDFLLLMKDAPFEYYNANDHSAVPTAAPSTKELSLKWSALYWPLVWRGNPNDQIMNDYVFDMAFIRNTLTTLSKVSLDQAEKNASDPPVVSAFVSPNGRRVIYSTDSRCSTSPLDHSIMQGIRSVAASEHERQAKNCDQAEETYLCLNFDVYTTHEPCSMCSMALIHSRIKRCIFLQPMRNTGALESQSGDKYCMHNNHALNSKYEVFRWLGSEYPVPEVNSDICC
ncbi:LAME_0H04698g1_1 [Lachancea meyersii CBS 8951]|uniref:LAME_0H04698g1_1 n=1 Tax=Lachancea meyersii CBS 8951 TaxID=1266667 RepID=A0A1G4KE23_9SACH|nr:LAME_0H04698g1_1 [Lachancea meyersii CBS 8951]